MPRQFLPRRCRAFVLDDSGSATAEYAIATLAAVGFAGLLVVILRSDAVRAMLTNLIQHALSF
jgi:Flp pilus assembly pilin Flp